MPSAENQVFAQRPTPTSDTQDIGGSFQNTYARLPEHFYAREHPTPVRAPRLVKLNVELAQQLGLDPNALGSPQGTEVLAGNRIAKGSEPLAIAYAGHQFGHFVPQLGDGRANLLGEVLDPNGNRYDIQLKGSGPTPFSRGGDGRAALGPVLREYLVSEGMAALGVPTTRALAIVATGEQVLREGVLPGAVLTRVAASHIRIGTFQYFAARGDKEAIARLADYAIARHYPDCADASKPYRSLLDSVIKRQAQLVAHWMLFGFIHGVMNTDNTAVSGETIDYGPCAFLEAYEPDKVFSSIDRRGRYAYSNQPHAIHWNLARLAEAIMPLLEQEEGGEEGALLSAHASLAAFGTQFEAARLSGWRRKIGLVTEQDGDAALIENLLDRMAENRADFTLTFRKLGAAAARRQGDGEVRVLFDEPSAYDTWADIWHQRLAQESTSAEGRVSAMLKVNPIFVPRNHLVQAAIDAAVEQNDFHVFENLLDAVTHPFDERPELERLSAAARPDQCISQTFCGT